MMERFKSLFEKIKAHNADFLPALKRIWKGYGYYFSLACLLLLFGVTAYIYRSGRSSETEYTMPQPENNIPVMAAAVTTYEPTPQPTPYSPSFALPVNGGIVGSYTGDELVWNDTLGIWSVHRGIDIMAELGAAVTASESGTVCGAYQNDLMGNIIEIVHEDNWVTRYCGVETLELTEIGKSGSKGDVISSVGAGGISESGMAAHLHFEVLHNGEQVQVEFE